MTTRPENRKTIMLLTILIAALAALATSFGIFSIGGPGSYPYESIRGETVQIYGKGLYRHMSADVAIQGIAQDYVTLFIAIPLLVISLIGYRRNSLKSRFLLAGTMGYFWVSFLFYTAMGMYNIMFLVYVALLCFSSFGLIILLLSFDVPRLDRHFTPKTPVKFTGGFLIFNSLTIALLWLSGIVPPLLDGTVYPDNLQHYTTLIVQGFDLGMLLPFAFVSGWLLIRRKPLGYLAGTVYFVFLSILMTALTAKIVAMALNGVNVVPVIFIIPAINGISILCAYSLIKNVLESSPETGQGS